MMQMSQDSRGRNPPILRIRASGSRVTDSGWRSGRVEAFFDRRALAMALRTLRGARSSIDLEMFLIGGRLGERTLRLLDRKARAGIRVRLIQRDITGVHAGGLAIRALARLLSFEGDRPEYHYVPLVERLFSTELRGSPIERRRFPMRLFRRAGFRPFRVAHDKILVVDDEIAVTGGMNLATAVARNHDVLVRVTGPAVVSLAAVFEHDWRMASDPEARPPDLPPEPRSGSWPHRLRFIVTRPRRAEQLDVILELIGGAARRVWVEMFVLAEPRIVAALAAARSRGLDVRVLVDPMEYSLGIRLHGAPNLPFVEDLLRAGVSVHLFRNAPGRQMHQKSVVADGCRVLTGTTNFTRYAFRANTESSILVEGDDVARIYEQRFLDDWLHESAPPDPAIFVRRRAWMRLIRIGASWI